MTSNKPFYIKETFPVYDLDFQSRKDLFNQISPFLVKNFDKAQNLVKNLSSHINSNNNGKPHHTENDDEEYKKDPKKLLEFMRIRPISMYQKKSHLEIFEKTVDFQEKMMPNLLENQANNNLSKKNITPPIISESSPLIKHLSSYELFKKIRKKEKLNLHNEEYLKSFYFAYDYHITDSVTMGISNKNLKTVSKHIKPDLYVKYLKSRSQKIIENEKELLHKRKQIKTPNYSDKRKLCVKKNNFFVVLSSNYNERVPIIHGCEKIKDKLIQEIPKETDQNKMVYSKPINSFRDDSRISNRNIYNLKNTKGIKNQKNLRLMFSNKLNS